ncbi:hypothetical protein Tco_0864162 [Tanacetum coccineum]
MVRFGNNQIEKIIGYGDYQPGNVTLSRVYYVEGLGQNLFSMGQFYDSDLEVAFRKHTCYVWNLDGADLLSGSRDTNLYTISLDDMLKSLISTDKTKITIKPSKNGQTRTREWKSVQEPEAKVKKSTSGDLDNSRDDQQDGKDKLVKSSTLIGSLMPRELKEAQEMMIFTLELLTQVTQAVTSKDCQLGNPCD